MYFLIGIACGLTRELAVVKYYQCIAARRAFLGSGLTLLLGLLDLFIIAKLAFDRNYVMVAGYMLGEAAGTYLAIHRS